MLSRSIVAASVPSLSVAAVAMPANDGAYPPTTTTVTVTETATAPEPTSSCTTGPIQCCNTVGTVSSNPLFGIILELLGIVVQGVDVLLGLNCDSIVGGQCSSNVVCCENNSVGGLINIGCIPITL